MRYLAAVTQLHIFPGSLRWNQAKQGYWKSKSPMKHSSHCPDCAGAAQQLPRNAGRAMIWVYRHTLSPLVGYNCRHLPTC
jgi:hypothetical protein